jgi:hypothetical protein
MKQDTSIPSSFVVFNLGFAFESFKEFGGASINCVQKLNYDV